MKWFWRLFWVAVVTTLLSFAYLAAVVLTAPRM